MARRGKSNGRRRRGFMYGGTSDDSDEDYTVDEDDEVEDESEDGFVGDESDESLDKLKSKKVKRIVRSRAPPRRKRNGTVGKPRKRKRVSYREDDDEGDDGDGVDKDDDEEFRPDCFDEEDEEEKFPVMKWVNSSNTPWLRMGPAKDDDYEEDEDDEGFSPDGLEEDDEFPVVKGMENSSKPRLCKGISKDDDEDVDKEDEEFTPDGLEEDDEFPVVKGMKNSSKSRLHKGISKDDDEDEDEEDEEFTPDGFEEDDEFPVVKRGMKNSSQPRLCKVISKDDDKDEDEEDEEFTPDGLDEEDDSPEIKRMKNSSKPRQRKGISKYDGEDEDEEDEEFTPDGLDEEEIFPVNRINNSSKPRLRKGISKDDEYEGEEDEEFTPGGLVGEEYSPVDRIKNSSKPRLRKGISNEDDIDEDEEDEEFAPDGLDEEEDFPVIERMKNSSEQRLREIISKEDDEEEDVEGEEFTPDGLDEEEDFPVIKNTRRSRMRKDDEDDEEFTPDSLDEEEEEFPAMDCSIKPRMRRKGIAKEHKRNRNPKELRRMTRKKPPKGLRLKRKARSSKEEEFIVIDPVVDEKIAGQRRKRKKLREDSDSDFVASSGPSDHEFTISEEEREQVREASKFCKGLVTVCRSSTSLKNPPKEEAPRPRRKDKLKVEELKTEAGKQICGICLSEQGKRTVRGTLNCCSHYYCYACIMEWSKVESRCPLCKQRFVTISKPAKLNTGFDLRTVVIQVPERDQVYQPSEEELRGYLDPYEDVLCTECQQGGDDALMLLCDLCDSPAHTYCVGLGREVPEGNWYCESCRPTALASLNQQNLNTPPPDNRTSSNYSVGSPPTPVLTFDLNEMYVPDTPMADESPGDFQSPRDGQAASLASGFGAHTVSDRRRIHLQIHQMLNDRRRQFGNSITGTVSGNRLFGSQITRTRDLVAQPAIAQRAVQHNNPRLSHYRIGLVPERSSNMSRQVNLNGASTSRSFFGEFLESELRGTDANMSLGLVPQQLHPCSSSRSYMGPDSSPSPCPFRESTVPSRTLPNTLRRPF